ncbi:hypothetical protein [Pseudonocardia alni]|uniref:hypothetical protein n=1 Tax=Pseudonocardia alni TaxID=33907 RepID=UPI00280AA7AD|nr:hypothetical protein [Pseudonocardia alni]
MTALELGAPLGIRTRQGVRDRLDRLDALLVHDRPDEQLTRESRRSARDRDARQVWIDDNLDRIRAVLAGLVAQVGRLWGQAEDDSSCRSEGPLDEDIREWLAELTIDYRDNVITPATFAVAGLLIGCVRGHPHVAELDRRHRLHSSMSGVDALRSDFAAGTS